MVDALAVYGDERRSITAISFGEVSSNLWSEDFWMGKPHKEKPCDLTIYCVERTLGSETSQYQEEKKPNSIS